ncbi:MAG: hypothetical protein K9L74_04040 [Candidatus Izimaplasma sp.]|nr:hypothetical protein [Candidatus Izimaplasma bacterium]
MIYIILGIISFVFMFLFDFFSLKQHTVLKYVSALFGIGLIFVSTVFILVTDSHLAHGIYWMIVFGCLTICSLGLVIYSVFYEVGRKAYKKAATPSLVTTGTYALSRHPGVLWLFLFYLFLSLTTANNLLFIATGVWTMMNILYVWLQEKVILPFLFPTYEQYKLTTPFIIPTKKSITNFIKNNRRN